MRSTASVGASTTTTPTPPKFFSAPFEIKPGEAVYLGRLIANLTGAEQRKEWLFNVTVPDQAFFAGENRFDEDRAALEHGFHERR